MSGSLPQQAITLDCAREQFYLAQRASEKFASQLASIVENLQQQKEDDAWLEQVKVEAAKIVHFHDEQHRQWESISGSVEAYMASVKQLAEMMAVNGMLAIPRRQACCKVITRQARPEQPWLHVAAAVK